MRTLEDKLTAALQTSYGYYVVAKPYVAWDGKNKEITLGGYFSIADLELIIKTVRATQDKKSKAPSGN